MGSSEGGKVMVKNFKSTFVNVHGSSVHSLVIFKVCFWLVNHGFKIDPNPEVWSDRVAYPGIPDVIATKYMDRLKSKKIVIREIESKYSWKAYSKKLKQFNTNYIDFDVIDISKLEKYVDKKITCQPVFVKFNNYIDEWIDMEMSKCLD